MKKLERSLGLKQIVIIGFSAMLGTGIFVTPGIIYASTGASLVFAYMLGALLVLPAAMSMSELATSMPTSGGIYVYTDRTFGPLLGTVVGFGLWLSLLFKCAFALMGFGEYLQVFSSIPTVGAALAMLVVVTILNIGGVGKVAGSLAIVVAACLVIVGTTGFLSIGQINSLKSEPLFAEGLSGFMVAVSLGVGAFAGLTKLTAIAEEVREPERNLSRGILFSLVGVAFVYVSTSFIIATALDHDATKGNLKPLFTLAEQALGTFGAHILAIIAILTLVSMANAGVLAASRFPFAMGRDDLLPKLFSKLQPKFLTPIWSILISGILVALIILTLDVQKVAKLASVFIILMFLLVNITVIALRESHSQWYKPRYRSPLYPALHLFGIGSSLVLLLFMGHLTILSLLMVGVPSVLIYFFYGSKTNRLGVMGIRGIRKDLVSDPQVDNKQYWTTCVDELEISKDAKLVVPLFGHEPSAEVLVEMGIALSDGAGVEVAHITEVPEQTELSDIEDPPGLKALRRRIHVLAEEKKAALTFDPVATHDLTKTLFEIGQRVHCQWLLVSWSGRRREKLTFHDPMGWVKDHLHCHLGWFADKGVRNFKKILILMKGNENDPLVLETASLLALTNGAVITIGREHANPESTEAQALEREMMDSLRDLKAQRINSAMIKSDPKAEAIIDLTVDYDLVIFGAENSSALERFLGTRDDRILARAACSVLCLSAASAGF